MTDLDERPRTTDPTSRRRPPRQSWWRRHKVLTGFTGLVAILLIVVGVGAFWLNSQLGNIPRISIDPPAAGRPAASENGAVNFLLAGVDNGDNGDSIAQEVASGTWKPGSHRSDTLIVLHLTPDRKHAYLVSIPRDSYVDVPGHGMQKINAAFSYGGPSLAVQTVEDFTNIRIDHTVLIDWNGFRDLATALGGVRVYVSETTASEQFGSPMEWQQGYTTLRGNRALSYVRTRYGLQNGDFDRIQRQQNFLRAALDQARSKGNLTNPGRLRALLEAITSNVTVDSGLSNRDITGLAFSLRHLRTQDITFVTTPMARFAKNASGDVVIPDADKTAALFGAVVGDELPQYVEANGADTLGPRTGIR